MITPLMPALWMASSEYLLGRIAELDDVAEQRVRVALEVADPAANVDGDVHVHDGRGVNTVLNAIQDCGGVRNENSMVSSARTGLTKKRFVSIESRIGKLAVHEPS